MRKSSVASVFFKPAMIELAVGDMVFTNPFLPLNDDQGEVIRFKTAGPGNSAGGLVARKCPYLKGA
jgi:hypothetical protein